MLFTLTTSCGGAAAPSSDAVSPEQVEDAVDMLDTGDSGANRVGSDALGADTGMEGGEVAVSVIEGGSYACTPPGTGPFPGVLYNHGGLATAVGGDLEATCRALAEAGYIAYSKQRRLGDSPAIAGHIDDLYEGLDALLALEGCDPDRVGIMGFSRGGLLTLQAATERPDAFRAVVTMAPASAKGLLDDVLEDADKIAAPVLVLVSINDLIQDDHVTLAQDVVDALEAEGKAVEQIVYDAYGDDGHERFFTVGDYWTDVTNFLATHL